MLEEAEQGNAYAMHDMGKIYAQGIGCEADKEKADVWYKKALAAMHYVEPVSYTHLLFCRSVAGSEDVVLPTFSTPSRVPM